MAKERDLTPGTPEAFRWGCKGTGHCTGGAHREGCALWDGFKAPDPDSFHISLNLGPMKGMVGSPAPVQRVVKGIKWTPVPVSSLVVGELYGTDFDYQFWSANGLVQGSGFIDPTRWGPVISPRMVMEIQPGKADLVWKMEFVY